MIDLFGVDFRLDLKLLEGTKDAVPKLDVLGEVTGAVGMVASMETGAKNTNVKIKTRVSDGTDEHVDPEAETDGDNVDGTGGHQPQDRHGGGGETSVEEVRRMSVGSIIPTTLGVPFSMMMLVDESIQKRNLVYDAVTSVVAQVSQSKDNKKAKEGIEDVHLLEFPHNSIAGNYSLDDKQGHEGKSDDSVKVSVEMIGHGQFGALAMRVFRKLRLAGKESQHKINDQCEEFGRDDEQPRKQQPLTSCPRVHRIEHKGSKSHNIHHR